MGIIHGRTIREEELERLDPLSVAHMYRKGALKPRDLTAITLKREEKTKSQSRLRR
jgi:hypothetical protein